MSALITLACNQCGRRRPYLRENDPLLPPEVDTITQNTCDLCGFDADQTERFWDAKGNEIKFVPLPDTDTRETDNADS